MPQNDIMTQSQRGEGCLKNQHAIEVPNGFVLNPYRRFMVFIHEKPRSVMMACFHTEKGI
jgi:hypothetical protein